MDSWGNLRPSDKGFSGKHNWTKWWMTNSKPLVDDWRVIRTCAKKMHVDIHIMLLGFMLIGPLIIICPIKSNPKTLGLKPPGDVSFFFPKKLSSLQAEWTSNSHSYNDSWTHKVANNLWVLWLLEMLHLSSHPNHQLHLPSAPCIPSAEWQKLPSEHPSEHLRIKKNVGFWSRL